MADNDAVLAALFAVIESRKTADPATSYTADLFSQGRQKLAQKLGEEAVETVIAAIGGDRDALVEESADLLYHLLVLWADSGIRPEEVLAELEARMGTSGLAEKAGRKRDSSGGDGG